MTIFSVRKYFKNQFKRYYFSFITTSTKLSTKNTTNRTHDAINNENVMRGIIKFMGNNFKISRQNENYMSSIIQFMEKMFLMKNNLIKIYQNDRIVQ